MYADLLDLSQPLIWTLPSVLSAAECQALIARIEAAGPEAAPITVPGGAVMRPDIRNNTRVILDDPSLAAALFVRVQQQLPPILRDRDGAATAVGANERFRCYKYEPGQRFALHYDGYYRRTSLERSRLTFMIYLNHDFTGGETNFPDVPRSVRPETGMALLFQHHLLHEGCPVTSGVKYALRSDIMYRLSQG